MFKQQKNVKWSFHCIIFAFYHMDKFILERNDYIQLWQQSLCVGCGYECELVTWYLGWDRKGDPVGISLLNVKIMRNSYLDLILTQSVFLCVLFFLHYVIGFS